MNHTFDNNSLYSPESFALLSALWTKSAWQEKHHYSFSWLGVPIIQLPHDILRLQECITQLKPDVILETGVAYGGSLLFYATLCEALGQGQIIGIEHKPRAELYPNLAAYPALAKRIQVIESSSVDAETVARVQHSLGGIPPIKRTQNDVSECHPLERGEPRFSTLKVDSRLHGNDKNGIILDTLDVSHKSDLKTTLVILDAAHSKAHVLAELELYAPFVSQGSYILVADTCFAEMFDMPRGKARWQTDNPLAAVTEFLSSHPEFVAEENRAEPSHFKGGWLRRVAV
jgi:cephalosporin hydroxylase